MNFRHTIDIHVHFEQVYLISVITKTCVILPFDLLLLVIYVIQCKDIEIFANFW